MRNMSSEITLRHGNPETSYDPQTKIWSGIKEPVDFDADFSLGKLLIERLLGKPDKIGQVCCYNGKEYTNQEIALSAISIANHFKKLGFQQGEVVGFIGSNTEYVASIVIGALLNGLVISSLDPSFDKDSITHIFSITRPSIVFCDGSIYNRVKSTFKEMGSQATMYTIVDHISGEPDITEFFERPSQKDLFQFEPLKEGGNQTAFIMCSSGTTGLPKGVCISHASFGNPKASTFFKNEDILLCYSSLYWASGLSSLIKGTLAGLTRLISKNAFSVEEFFCIVEKYKPSIFLSPSSHLALSLASPKIGNCDFSSIKHYVIGGSAALPSLIAKLKTFLSNAEFIVVYGMFEMPGCGIASGSADENGSVGKLSVNVEMKIINDDNEGLGPNKSGEILVRSFLPFSGYYGNAEATAATYDKDGWIHSGDIGYVDEDGKIYIVDRKKDILKYNNFHFFPTEIETVIMEIPDVIEVCVCGISDEISSFLPAAMIVLKSGCNITEDDIYKYVADKMDHFKQLRGGVFFVENIPKTPSGKKLRRKVVELCEVLRNSKKN